MGMGMARVRTHAVSLAKTGRIRMRLYIGWGLLFTGLVLIIMSYLKGGN